MPHTVFVFEAASSQLVLPAFAELLLTTYPEPVTSSDAFVARAIGRIGQRSAADEGGAGVPRHLGEYWPAYEARPAKVELVPQTLAGFVRLAQRRRGEAGDCADSVQTVARGLIHLIGGIVPAPRVSEARGINWLQGELRDDAAALQGLRQLVWRWCVARQPIAEEAWADDRRAVRSVLRPVIGDGWSPEAVAFTAWSPELADKLPSATPTERGVLNRYWYTNGDRSVHIDVGTIHGAKGQTHTATLVLETFYKKRDLADLLPWLLRRPPKGAQGAERQERRRIVYTAMTRPTHLLCLALRSDALSDDEAGVVKGLEWSGWTVRRL